MPTPPRFIYFDLGNVLLNFDHSVACRQMAEVAGISAERVREVVYDGGLQRRYEAGEISCRQFYDQFCKQTDTRPDYDALQEAGSAIFELNVGVVPIVAQLCAAHYRLGILSNTCPAHWNYISSGRFAMIREMFEVYVLSFETGVMKPDAAIYQTAARRAGVAPKEVFYTDDREENVAGAKRAGFDATVYTSPPQLAADLRERGVEFNY